MRARATSARAFGEAVDAPRTPVASERHRWHRHASTAHPHPRAMQQHAALHAVLPPQLPARARRRPPCRVRCDAASPSFGRRAAGAAAAAAALAGAARLGAGAALAGCPRFPPLGGPHAVGGVDIRLPCRREASDHADADTSFRCRVLYPCEAPGDSDAARLPYMGAPAATEGFAQAASLSGLVRFPAFLTTHLAAGDCGVLLRPRAAAGAFPSLVYSHGFGGNAQMGTRVLAEIASHGVVVLAVEHTDGSASRTVRSDGSVLRFGERQPGGRGAGLSRRMREQLAAAEALALRDAALPADVVVAVDASRCFLGGHSYGAPTTLLSLRGGSFAGALLHDAALPVLPDDTLRQPLGAPCLYLLSDEYIASPFTLDTVVTASHAAARGTGVFSLVGSAHGNYVDAPYWAARPVMRGLSRLGIPACGAAPADEVLRVIGTTAAAFLAGADAGVAGFAAAQPRLVPLELMPRTPSRGGGGIL